MRSPAIAELANSLCGQTFARAHATRSTPPLSECDASDTPGRPAIAILPVNRMARLRRQILETALAGSSVSAPAQVCLETAISTSRQKALQTNARAVVNVPRGGDLALPIRVTAAARDQPLTE